MRDSGVQRNPLPFLANVSGPSHFEGRKLGNFVVRIGEGCVGSRKVVLAVHLGIFLDALAAGEAADDLSAHAAHHNTADDDEDCGRQNDPPGPLEVRQEDQDVDQESQEADHQRRQAEKQQGEQIFGRMGRPMEMGENAQDEENEGDEGGDGVDDEQVRERVLGPAGQSEVGFALVREDSV